MSDTAGDHVPSDLDRRKQSIEDENVRDTGVDMPGMRGALTPGSLEHASTDPNLVQGDEHRDPPASAPTPPQPGDSPKLRSVPDPAIKP